MEPIRFDGRELFLDDEGWFLVRLSGTEPLVRCCGETWTPQALARDPHNGRPRAGPGFMNVWHLTHDAPRAPHRVTPGRLVRVQVGTWPIEPEQHVVVEFMVSGSGGRMDDGRVRASWIENRESNSYWTASFGPFRDGDRVRYRIEGTVGHETMVTDRQGFTVGPVVYVALVWHFHQPLYRDLNSGVEGMYQSPWVRLHALRDYYGMAALVAPHPEIHLPVNFSGILLEQLEEYAGQRALDRALVLTRTQSERLSSKDRRELVATVFDAHWHHQIYPHPRYRQLFEQRVQGRRFSEGDLTDLRMWFNRATICNG